MIVLPLSSALRDPDSTPSHARFRLRLPVGKVGSYRVRSFQMANTLQNLRRGAVDYSVDNASTWKTYYFDVSKIPITPMDIIAQLNMVGLTCALSLDAMKIDWMLGAGVFVRPARDNLSDFLCLPPAPFTGSLMTLLVLQQTQQVGIWIKELESHKYSTGPVGVNYIRDHTINIPISSGYGTLETFVNTDSTVHTLAKSASDFQTVEVMFFDIYGDQMVDVQSWSIVIEFYM